MLHGMYPIPIEQLIKAFTKLPSVGRRTAERFVFYLLKSGKKDVVELSAALKHLVQYIKSCEQCWDFSDASPCKVCTDLKRNSALLCVVAEPQDQRALERTGAFNGQYHILRGTLNPEREHIAQHLKIAELISRIKDQQVSEVILALNPDLRGETTMMYLERNLKKSYPNLTISRLARGLPMGSDMQYADEVTLSSALKHRTKQ